MTCAHCGAEKTAGESCESCGQVDEVREDGFSIGQFDFKDGDVVFIQGQDSRMMVEVATHIQQSAATAGKRLTLVLGKPGVLNMSKMSPLERRFIASKLLTTQDPIAGIELFLPAGDPTPPTGYITGYFAGKRFQNEALAAQWIRGVPEKEREGWMTLKLNLQEGPADELLEPSPDEIPVTVHDNGSISVDEPKADAEQTAMAPEPQKEVAE